MEFCDKSLTYCYEWENVVSLIVLQSEQKHQAQRGSQAQNTGEYTQTRQIESHLQMEIRKTLLKIELYLLLVEFAQHDDGVEEHDDVAPQHFPDVEEDGLEADIIKTPSSEGIHLKAIETILLSADVNHVLLQAQAVLVSHLELEPDSSRSNIDGILRNLEQHLDPGSLGGHHMTGLIPRHSAQIVEIVPCREEPRTLRQGIDGVQDVLGGEVTDDLSVEVPDLQ